MESYQERVIEEKKELDEKINRLSNFINSDKYNQIDVSGRIRFDRQLAAMQTYSNILNERINTFTVC